MPKLKNLIHLSISPSSKLMIFAALIISFLAGSIAERSAAIVIGSIKFTRTSCFPGISATKVLCCAECKDCCWRYCRIPHSCSIAAKMYKYQGIRDQSHIDYATSSQVEEDLENALKQIHDLRKEDKENVLSKMLELLDIWCDKESDITIGSVKAFKKGDDCSLDVKLTKRVVEDILSQSNYTYTLKEMTKIITSLTQ